MNTWLRAALGRSLARKSHSSTPATSQLVALQIAGQASWTPRTYQALAKEGYQRNAVVYRCIRMIAESAASVPFQIGSKVDAYTRQKVETLLAFPNPKVSRAEFMEAHYGYLKLSGDAYLEAVIVNDEPVALYTLRPDRVRAIVGKTGWPVAWEYRAGSNKKHYPIDPVSGRSSIHHMRLFHPSDDLVGFSPLAAAAQAVDVHNAGGVWTKSLLDNSARPSGALIYKGAPGERLDDDQFARLKSELETHHAGAKSAGRPLLLEGGLDWKSMSHTPADMDFINARRDAAREIALAFGVPPMLLGIPGDNTYANYKEANSAFWRQTIYPLVNKTAESFALWLRPWLGEDLHITANMEAIPAENKELDT
ncbi:MAG TPA: phage portal protein [Hellea balneolensis]|uniref:Phage portal protein n=1 Tax=Hellea balneolensis TaxID=287478 RepID=A0A7C5M085_9PROT|nr:phage portal protein [Hellea balneolensis]